MMLIKFLKLMVNVTLRTNNIKCKNNNKTDVYKCRIFRARKEIV